MKNPKKIVLILVAAVVALIVVVALGRNILIRASVPTAVRSATGFDASVGGVDVGLFSSHVQIRNLVVKNPEDFPDKRMLIAPEIYVEYKLGSMLASQREFPKIKLDVNEVVVVKLASGESNLARMQSSISGEEKKEESAGKSKTANHIDSLELRIGKVIYVDYTKGSNGKPAVSEVTLNFKGNYQDISDKDTTRLIMLVSMQSLGVTLPDVKLGDLQANLKDVSGIGKDLMGSVTNITGGVMKDLGGLFKSGTGDSSRSK